MNFKHAMGAEVKDVVTGFKGVITARVEYVTGCRQYLVNPRKLDKDGKPAGSIYYDEDRLVVTGRGLNKIMVDNPGGPQADEPRRK